VACHLVIPGRGIGVAAHQHLHAMDRVVDRQLRPRNPLIADLSTMAAVISAYPAYRWPRLLRPRRGPPPTSPGSVSYAIFYSACSPRSAPDQRSSAMHWPVG
jgi:hypothetical protein